MTSRSSFFKLMKEDLRQRLWTIILAATAFLLPVPIYIAMDISSSRGFGNGMLDNFARRLAEPMGPESIWMVLVTVVGALICAVSGFGYLFSKKKVDFFHSLPVKRETLFAVRYVNGVLIYLVPYLAMVLVSFVIMAVTGNFAGVAVVVVAKGLAVHLLGYLTVYTTLILCVTFVGNIVVFFAVSGWTFGITAVTVLVYSWFEEQFFDTYSYMGDVYVDRIHALRFLCPGYFYIRTIDDVLNVSLLLQQLAFAVVLTVITLCVYRIRSSEGAGKAIAFPILKPVIRLSVEFLAGALMGMMFFNMADNSREFPGWMVFGVILGVVLSHMLIQSIFYFDVRKCFAEKVSMFACVAVAAMFVLVMRYDVFGYDRYLPKAKKIESVAIDLQSLDNRRDSFLFDNGNVRWFDEVKEMRLTDLDTVYPYLEVLVEDSALYAEGLDPAMAYSSDDFLRVEVAYHLKNGKTVSRRYWVNGIREDLFAPIFESYEYKKVHYADIYTMPAGVLTSVSARCAMNTRVMELTVAEKEELMMLVNRELAAMTLEEKLYTRPVAILDMIVGGRGRDSYGNYYTDNWNTYTNELPIYPSYTETLRFLADRGFTTDAEYEWTGKERMRVRLPEIQYKDGAAYYTTETYSAGAVEVTEYVLADDIKYVMAQIEYPMDWEYGENMIPVDEEDFKRLYELCTWEPLCRYGDPTFDVYDNYRVYLDVPQDGYNMYETFNYIVPKDADLSFLFD